MPFAAPLRHRRILNADKAVRAAVQGEAVDECAPTLTEIIHDRSFRALLRLSLREAMTWDTFLKHPLPPNMSPLSVWDMLGSIGSCIGVHLFPDAEQNLLWYRRTHELSDLVDEISRRSSKDSPLYEALLDHADRTFTLGLRLAEAVSASRLAGIPVDRDQLEMHVRLGAPPEKPIERIVANAVAVDADLPSLADEPFSQSLLAELHRRVVEGVDPDDVGALSAQYGDGPIDETAWALVQQQLDRIVSYAEREDDDGEDLSVLRGNLVADALRYHRPFGIASTFVASLASKLFYLKNDLPVLAVAPLSAAKYRWTEGALDEVTLCGPAEYESTRRRSCCDLTVHHTLSAECIAIELDKIEKRLTGIAHRDRAARSMLSADPRFNHRQRSILARALRTPLAEFHIRYHQEKNRISYATARRDLVELTDAGYLRAEQRGKAFVFVADSRIEELSRNL